jgi:ABC-type dipeptide/oligopeptide/nickel transport system permease subunit
VTDLLIQRVMDSIMAFPALVLAMTLVAVLGPDLINVIVAIGIVTMPGVARVVRGATLAVRHRPYVEAARCIGARSARVLLLHVAPNVVAPIIVLASIGLGGAILAETGLSFLGLGAQPPTPSWGLLLSSDGRRFMEEAPWLALFPGLAIMFTVLAFNLLGDALRDVLDPRLRSR